MLINDPPSHHHEMIQPVNGIHRSSTNKKHTSKASGVILREDERVEIEMNKNQMTIRDEFAKDNYVYIEKFTHSTFPDHVYMTEKDPKF
jgi:hypothetical protein